MGKKDKEKKEMVNLIRQERLLKAKQKLLDEQEAADKNNNEEELTQEDKVESAIADEIELFTTEQDLPVAKEAESDVKTNRIRFKPASQRATLAERDLNDEADRKLNEMIRLNEEDRVKESKDLVKKVVVYVDADEERRALKPKGTLLGEEDIQMPDDNDDINPEKAREDWEKREIQRIIGDILERESRMKDIEELERRRTLTDEQRIAEDQSFARTLPQAEKGTHKYQYMQKWFHKGAFFQDESQTEKDSIYLRDFQQPTAADMTNRESLPAPMKLRRGQFGMKGATKYTHLRDQDTTDKTSAMICYAGGPQIKESGIYSKDSKPDNYYSKKRRTK